ncbi:MAG: AsmA-like C-terminal region-containing protein, partial [Pseudomonadota bacterium]
TQLGRDSASSIPRIFPTRRGHQDDVGDHGRGAPVQPGDDHRQDREAADDGPMMGEDERESRVVGGAAIRDLELEARPGDDAWNIAQFQATIPGRTQIRASGALKTDSDFGFNGSLVVASNQPSGLAAMFSPEIDPAIRKLARAGIAAEVELTPETQSFQNMELDLDGELLTGSLVNSFPQTGSAIRTLLVELYGDVLDLDATRALIALADVNGTADGAQRMEAKLDLKGLEFGSIATGPVIADLAVTQDEGAQAVEIEDFQVQSVAGVNMSASGKLGGEGGYDLAVKVDGDSLATALSLLATRYEGVRPLMSHLLERPGLTENTDIAVKLVSREGRLDLSSEGTVGGTTGTVSFVGPADLTKTDIRDADLTLSARLTQPNPARLFAQFAVPTIGLAFEDTFRADLDLNGRLGSTMTGRAVLRTNDDRVLAEGPIALPGDYDPEKRFVSQLRADQMVTASVGDVGRWATMFGRVLPNQIEGLPASAQARLLLSGSGAEFRDAKGVFDGNSWAGDLMLRTDARRPELSGDLTVETLSFDAVAQWVLGQGVTAQSFVARDLEPFGPNTLAGLDADLRLVAGTVTTGLGQSLENVRTRFKLDDGSVSFDNGEGTLAGAKVAGSLALSPGPDASAIEVRGTVAQVDVNDIAPWASALDGKAEVSFDLQGTGATPADIVRQLTGGGTVSATELRINGLSANLLGSVLRSADAREEPYGQEELNTVLEQRLGNGSFYVPQVALPFSVAGGQLRANALRLVGDGATLSLNAEMDLVAGQVDLDGSLEFDQGAERIAGAQAEINVAFQGPIVAPVRQINGSGLASYLTLRSFEREQRRVELLQARILERQRLRREVRYYEVAKLRDEDAQAREAEAAAAARADRLAREAARAAERARPEPTPQSAPQTESLDLPPLELETLPGLDLTNALPRLDDAPATDAAPSPGELPPLESFDIESLPGLFTDSSIQAPAFAN